MKLNFLLKESEKEPYKWKPDFIPTIVEQDWYGKPDWVPTILTNKNEYEFYRKYKIKPKADKNSITFNIDNISISYYGRNLYTISIKDIKNKEFNEICYYYNEFMYNEDKGADLIIFKSGDNQISAQYEDRKLLQLRFYRNKRFHREDGPAEIEYNADGQIKNGRYFMNGIDMGSIYKKTQEEFLDMVKVIKKAEKEMNKKGGI